MVQKIINCYPSSKEAPNPQVIQYKLLHRARCQVHELTLGQAIGLNPQRNPTSQDVHAKSMDEGELKHRFLHKGVSRVGSFRGFWWFTDNLWRSSWCRNITPISALIYMVFFMCVSVCPNFLFLFLIVFIYLAALGLSCGTWDLCCSAQAIWLQHVGLVSLQAQLLCSMWDLSSPIRDRTVIPLHCKASS